MAARAHRSSTAWVVTWIALALGIAMLVGCGPAVNTSMPAAGSTSEFHGVGGKEPVPGGTPLDGTLLGDPRPDDGILDRSALDDDALDDNALDDNILDVLTFNTALLPPIAASTRQQDRAALMAPHLLGYDALVLEEAFVNEWRDRLLRELAASYPYRSEVVGADGAGGNPFRQDGGIVILSRWPIERQAVMRFGGVCSGTDCLADKGVAYVAIRKGRFLYHLFGTHAQSVYGFGVESVRRRQFQQWRAFIASLNIPSDEPVLLAGDFNVDAYTPELTSMLSTLNAVRPMTTGPNEFTWDPAHNVFATGPRQWLDYVLVAADHAQPVVAWNRVVTLRSGSLDLSDHFAVWGRVVMDDR